MFLPGCARSFWSTDLIKPNKKRGELPSFSHFSHPVRRKLRLTPYGLPRDELQHRQKHRTAGDGRRHAAVYAPGVQGVDTAPAVRLEIDGKTLPVQRQLDLVYTHKGTAARRGEDLFFDCFVLFFLESACYHAAFLLFYILLRRRTGVFRVPSHGFGEKQEKHRAGIFTKYKWPYTVLALTRSPESCFIPGFPPCEKGGNRV